MEFLTKMMKRGILAPALTVALGAGFLAIGGLKADDCSVKACSKYVSCTESLTGQKATAQQRAQLTAGCRNTCKKHNSEMMECYSQSSAASNSCQVYYSCIRKHYSK